MFSGIIYVCVVVLLCFNGSLASEDDPVVTLPYGKVEGHILSSENDNIYYAFQEIPYASPPVGNLRFKPPVAPKNWDAILITKENTKICYQPTAPIRPTESDLRPTEDCLYLNVYTPQKPDNSSKNPLPVLVWIHGGAFFIGDGTFNSFGPKLFMDYDVIIVTINYRLGPLGFLSTGDDVIPGNLGLKDQNFAIRWVKENIKFFGGDPEKIILSGQSAGAFSAGYQLISKKSEGLFRGAILHSGTPVSPGGYQAFPRYLAFQLGKTIDPDFASDDSNDLLSLLQNTSAADITFANVVLPDDVYVGDLLWTPVIEDESDGAFITGPMHDDIKNGNFNKVPILIGFTSEEQLILVLQDESGLKQKGVNFDQDPSTLIELIFNITEEDQKSAGSELKKVYTDSTFQSDFAALVSFMSDEVFTTPIARHADLQSKYTDVYVYQFSYKGDLGGMRLDIEGLDPNAVGHTEDLGYIWDLNIDLDSSKYPEEDILTRNRMLKMWTNFIKHLNPTPEEDSLLQNVTWPKVSSENFLYLNINVTLEVETDPKQYKKWEEIVDTYASPPFITY